MSMQKPELVTVSPKFQVVIPKRLRERAGIKVGQRLDMYERDGVIELVLVLSVKAARGFLGNIETDIASEADREI
ncbi:hypothetical protein GCM10011529_12600 [Polymorphobacter glacialis]|uniref:SpoVT-AbrB domain-containing protein n=1 Tax=Sandarakinorhabdus glacialis TaxID=1614636 RepID=A0A916ZPI6_9SPHN|nr:AbrB/MazE/SpoVT family DNA-binding domain-containing protein [Polymorphobacter glacialis]GGE07686.1 hypothetical protein GCM10011529_12600 [Polymorphobacter glacialis]